MGKTSIEWSDHSWNPLTGCTKVSAGCKNCYAERQFPRTAGKCPHCDGEGDQWDTYNGVSGPRPCVICHGTGRRPFTDVRVHPERLQQPLRRIAPTRYFVNSMSDLFHEDVPFEFIADVFAVMACTTRHTYQVITKRPRRMLEWFSWLRGQIHEDVPPHQAAESGWHDFPAQVDPIKIWPEWIPQSARRGGYDNCGATWPLENVWLGVSCENQETADERYRYLRGVPASIRFWSVEPMLAPIPDLPLTGIHWVIIGGESGPKARPFDVQWARDIIAQCRAAGVPVFVKQMGFQWAKVQTEHANAYPSEYTYQFQRKGGDPSEWPNDLRVRDFPR